MTVKDEADIIDYLLDYLLRQVDEVHVRDNLSTDGTRERLEGWKAFGVRVDDDIEVAYHQSQKMSALAEEARQRGHEWVIPVDADEVWYANGRTVSSFLGGLGREVMYVNAELYNHLPTSEDQSEFNPLMRIKWRQRERAPLFKVACRCRPELVIHQGNHSAWAPGGGLTGSGLTIRHFSWRTRAQYLTKIRNGERAYKATGLGEDVGAHWRMFEGATDEAVMDHFVQWFYIDQPRKDSSLILDPAPLREGV